ncbi:hypothetical protein C2869_03680 [Saccharobesus litoralis]|uniref:Uncharacterized protein n=1 Tax=Saccharobesus litoralis TaxID=2172099 RepID=A0A2S0VN43_9ALTE|nr:hypothetical protein [Saccharobesus litoralis]AWB65589.1 hypothetical protein C2869_03680 [Saccharobesus litoralis]
MKFITRRLALLLIATLTAPITAFNVAAHDKHHGYSHEKGWLKPAEGQKHIGQSHGEIAVSKNGDIYVSVMGKQGGIQVFSPQGKYLRNLPKAPWDIHALVIKQEGDKEFIYAPTMFSYKILKMDLQGNKVLEIDALKTIPERYHNEITVHKNWTDKRKLRLSGIAVADSGEMYIVDGYGRDFIHQFDGKGNYLTTFAGKGKPWKFSNCHKIAIDPRYTPKRLLCTDRNNDRLVHMQLDGTLIGDYATDLRKPSAVAFYKDKLAVAEIRGRVSILDINGKIVNTIGTNDNAKQIGHDRTAPKDWQDGIFTSPHGIAFDAKGNLLITEYSKWGRVLKFNVKS